MKKINLALCFILLSGYCFAQNVIPFPDLKHPTAIYINDGHLFVVNGRVEINVFSLNDFKFKFRFGKLGTGVGEFKIRPDHQVSLDFPPQKILVNSDRKVTFFTRTGTFIREVKLRGDQFTFSYRTFGKGYASLAAYSEKKIPYFAFNIYDNNFKIIKEVTRVLNDYQPGKGLFAFAMSWQFYVAGENLFIHEKEKGLVIDQYDPAGKYLNSIKNDYLPVKVEKSHIDGVHQGYKTSPYTKDEYNRWIKDALVFPEFFPAVRFWNVADNLIYVFTYLEKGDKTELYIFDEKGNLIQKKFVPFYRETTEIDKVNPYTIKNQKLFQMKKNKKNKIWELHITDLINRSI